MSLANIIGNMAKTISKLNSMLNCERSKTENLLAENFSLKLKNQELQTLMETLLNFQKSHNKSPVDASSKTLEIRSELITEADRHHKGSNSEDDTVIELSNNPQSNENKQKRPSKAKRKSLQRQKTKQARTTTTIWETEKICSRLRANTKIAAATKHSTH